MSIREILVLWGDAQHDKSLLRVQVMMLGEKQLMDIRKRTAVFLLIAINIWTVVKLLVYPGDYGLLFWLAAAVPFFVFHRACALASRRARDGILLYVILFTGVYLVLWWGSGYIYGFGRSPYSRSAQGILRNIGLFGGTIATQELVRAYALGAGRNSRWMTVITAASLCLCDFNFYKVKDAFSGLGSLFPYVGGTLLPAVLETVFLTWLSKTAGPAPALVYRLAPQMIQWLLPVLPKTSWQANMILSAAVPLFALIIIQQMIAGRLKSRGTQRGHQRRRRTNPAAWACLMAVLVVLFSFSLGLMPYKPMVIATGSMLPVIRPGDMVIMKDTDAGSLQVGDIAVYLSGDHQIVHRVTAISPTPNGNSFVFKGDNNDAPDAKAVEDAQILGKVVQIVPYVGLLSLAVRTADSPEDVPVQTGNASR